MSQPLSRAELRAAIEDVLYTGCLLLDAQQLHAWLEHTSSDLQYRITAHSPEIRKQMTWLEHDRQGLVALFELLPKHHVNHAQWQRHASLYQVVADSATEVRAVTSLVVHHTLLDVGDVHEDAGATQVFAVGRYHDKYRLEQGRWLLTDRTVHLETRQLGIGTHMIV